MSCLIKDEKSFLGSLQTDDRLWQIVKEIVEANAIPFERAHRTIFDHPAVILQHSSNQAHAPEGVPEKKPSKRW